MPMYNDAFQYVEMVYLVPVMFDPDWGGGRDVCNSFVCCVQLWLGDVYHCFGGVDGISGLGGIGRGCGWGVVKI